MSTQQRSGPVGSLDDDTWYPPDPYLKPKRVGFKIGFRFGPTMTGTRFSTSWMDPSSIHHIRFQLDQEPVTATAIVFPSPRHQQPLELEASSIVEELVERYHSSFLPARADIHLLSIESSSASPHVILVEFDVYSASIYLTSKLELVGLDLRSFCGSSFIRCRRGFSTASRVYRSKIVTRD